MSVLSMKPTASWPSNTRRNGWLIQAAIHCALYEGMQHDGGTTRTVQWYFDNLLHEEGQRTLLAGAASLDAQVHRMFSNQRP
mgnify:CR=1 FL=1